MSVSLAAVLGIAGLVVAVIAALIAQGARSDARRSANAAEASAKAAQEGAEAASEQTRILAEQHELTLRPYAKATPVAYNHEENWAEVTLTNDGPGTAREVRLWGFRGQLPGPDVPALADALAGHSTRSQQEKVLLPQVTDSHDRHYEIQIFYTDEVDRKYATFIRCEANQINKTVRRRNTAPSGRTPLYNEDL